PVALLGEMALQLGDAGRLHQAHLRPQSKGQRLLQGAAEQGVLIGDEDVVCGHGASQLLLSGWLEHAALSMPSRDGVVKFAALRQSRQLLPPRPAMRSQALRADLLMLLTAMIWGSAFVAQRLGMDAIGPFLYTGLRFALASLALLPLVLWLGKRDGEHKPEPVSRGLLLGGLAMGLALSLGINLQQVGLLFTSVTNSGFITGLYVIVVPLLGL